MSPLFLAGLQTLQKSFINNWIGPAFLIVVAAVSIKFLMSRQFRELFAFVVIAMIVAVFIFAGQRMFGEGGIFTQIGEGAAEQLNMIYHLRL